MFRVLVRVEVPRNQQQWLAFLSVVAAVAKSPGFRELGEGVWELDFQQTPGAFAELVAGARRFGLVAEILPLPADAVWLKVDVAERA